MNEICQTDDAAAQLHDLREDVAALREAVEREGAARLAELGAAEHPSGSARNLTHYLALRSRDLTALQLRLAAFGLSSLGRSEADVAPALDALLVSLGRLCGERTAYPPRATMRAGEEALTSACERVFGPSADPRRTRIMATLPGEAADDAGLVATLIAAGADCVRINCAHDDADAWLRMIANTREASRRLARPCRILMDIAGPKLRLQDVHAPQKHRLARGDRLRFVPDAARVEKGLAASLNFPNVLRQLHPGAEVSFDDGKAVGRVVACDGDGADIEIVAARAKGLRLKPDKGVNFPSLDLDLAPLTAKDVGDLDVIAREADLVGFSFVQSVEDVAMLQDELAARRGDKDPQTLVLKIETPLAARNLPRLIIQASARHPTAVMIARGDLAVEAGFARLSEMQEEILWLCAAARVPAIWATQVLEQFVHEGVASRPEMTDAAMAQRADCVMLNKGAYLPGGVALLRDVIERMERHQARKFARLPRLRIWS